MSEICFGIDFTMGANILACFNVIMIICIIIVGLFSEEDLMILGWPKWLAILCLLLILGVVNFIVFTGITYSPDGIPPEGCKQVIFTIVP